MKGALAQPVPLGDAVGYLYDENGHTHDNAWCHTPDGTETTRNVELSTYCAPSSGKLVFRLSDPDNSFNQWHASDLLVNYIGGGSGYIRNGRETFEFLDVKHAVADKVF